MLLGTAQQVWLASSAATELVAGRPVHTDELVISLRHFIRTVLDLDPLSGDLAIPKQGPARPGAVKAGGRGDGGGDGEKGARGSGADMGAGGTMAETQEPEEHR